MDHGKARNSLPAAVEQVIVTHSLLQRGSKVVIAVSGGPDSVALFHLLHRLATKHQWKLIAAHLNHRFREEEAVLEAKGIDAMAKQLGWPVEIGEFNVPHYVKDTGANAQAAAREHRYDFLLRTAQKHQADCVALAHHADDQAETFLMNLLRGSGGQGLKGMELKRSWRNFDWIRPLLQLRKERLIQYCAEEQLTYFVDSSNNKGTYRRNQLRLEALPYLQRFNPQLTEALNRTVEILSTEHAYMEAQTKQAFQQQVKAMPDGYRMDRDSLLSLHPALQRRLITLILRYLSPEAGAYDFQRVESIREAIRKPQPSNMELHITEDIRLYREYETVCLQKPMRQNNGKEEGMFYSLTEVPCNLVIEELGLKIEADWISKQEVSLRESGADDAVFDADELVFPLHLRLRHPGDRMRIKGLAGRKKIKDILIDEKVPPSARQRIPMLLDDHGQILWLIGLRRSDRALVKEGTARCLHIRCKTDIL